MVTAGRAQTGAGGRHSPAADRPTLLLEAADLSLARRCADPLRRAGFHVTLCSGARPGGDCPLLGSGACPLVQAADVVVHALMDPRGRAILRSLRRAGVPVLALTDPGTAQAPVGGDSAPADLPPTRLVDEVRRTYASRARGLRVPVRLRDGRRVWIQAISPQDAEFLREFDGDLSEPSRRFRYLGRMAPMSSEAASALASVDFRDRFSLVAVARKGHRRTIVADCRLVPIPDRPGSAEVAIAVADRYQGAGLGRALLELMLGIAHDRGLAEVVAEVRYDNLQMMHLLRELGFERSAWELGVVTFTAAPSAGHLEQLQI